MTAEAWARLCRRLLAKADGDCEADDEMRAAAAMVYIGDPYPLTFSETASEGRQSRGPDPVWPFIR